MSGFAGKALPGGELRGKELDFEEIEKAVNAPIYPGTFNISLMEAIDFQAKIVTERYSLVPCRLFTTGMIERDEPGIPGWVIRVNNESLPANFVEVVSPHHIRRLLKKTNWPSFPIEIMLNSSGEAAKVDTIPVPGVRNPSSGAA